MDDARVGTVFRAVRIRQRWTQTALAKRAGVSRSTVSRLERGQIMSLPLVTVRQLANALGVWIELAPRWRGADTERLLNSAHTALHASVGSAIRARGAWTTAPEVSYSIYGERGVIDILAWHEQTRSLLVVELKTMLVDPGELLATMDRRVRLAPRIARERGWDPATIGAWVVITDTRTNRRHVASSAGLLRAALPSDGHAIRRWLRAPNGSIHALSFWSDAHAVIIRRVGRRRARAEPGSHEAVEAEPATDP
jgi:transcriptional regulator with XRE-family HTH domain